MKTSSSISLFVGLALLPAIAVCGEPAATQVRSVKVVQAAGGAGGVVVIRKAGQAAKPKVGSAVVVVQKNGKVISGLLAKDGKDAVTIKTKDGKATVIARKDVEEIRSAVRKPKVLVGQAVGGLFRQAGNLQNAGIRKDVDAKDNVERMLLLFPGGPAVVQMNVNVDGQPFRMAREKLVEELLASSDTDGDKKPTWPEAFANPRFPYSRLLASARTPAQKVATLKRYDRNSNGTMDVQEARTLIAQYGGGAAFLVRPNPYAGRQPDVKSVLDTDKDGVLSKQELAATEERLKSRDANDNDLLEASELGGGAAGLQYRQRSGRTRTTTSDVHLLGPTADLVAVFNSVKKKYAGKDGIITAASFPCMPKLVAELDSGEVIGFQLLKPNLVLDVNLGSGENSNQGITVKSATAPFDPKLASRKASNASLVLETIGLQLKVSTPTGTTRTYDYTRTAQSMITRYDTDKNGYIEKKELEKAAGAQYVVSQFAGWDTDADGKVFLKEIKASYDRMLAPRMSQITAISSSTGPSMFAAMDTTGDNRLSLREMRIAGDRLQSLDKNKDDKIGFEEMPGEIAIALSRGGAYYGQRTFIGRQRPSTVARPAT
jgi:hypothetical protein